MCVCVCTYVCHSQPVTWPTDITDCPNSLTPILTGNHHNRHEHRPVRPTRGALHAVQICRATDCSTSSCQFCTPVYVTVLSIDSKTTLIHRTSQQLSRSVQYLLSQHVTSPNEHHNSSADQCITYSHSMWLVPLNITTAQPIYSHSMSLVPLNITTAQPISAVPTLTACD